MNKAGSETPVGTAAPRARADVNSTLAYDNRDQPKATPAPQRPAITQTVGFGEGAISLPAPAPSAPALPAPALSVPTPAAPALSVPTPPAHALSATVAAARPSGATTEAEALSPTVVGEAPVADAGVVVHPPPTARMTQSGRTTVLPRTATPGGPDPFASGDDRFTQLRPLGEGGMGEVVLVKDLDIGRAVAVKRLRTEVVDVASLLRFTDEIRTIGKLEHPNIIPIHDVGIDELGRHYFVMKYVQGDTLETIIEKLVARDPEYTKRYTMEYRTTIFLGILQAVRYAHAHGVIHRDIKPANIMVGPYGEVTVMDWGIAKKIRGDATLREPTMKDPAVQDPVAPTPAQPPPDDAANTDRRRMFQTRHGALLGTPAYMSPEQALGKTDEIDERSDVYSLSVMFHELLTLEHYLADKTTLQAMLLAVSSDPEISSARWNGWCVRTDLPSEMKHFLRRGMTKDPTKRIPSVEAMVQAISEIQNGRVQIECQVTMTKRMLGELSHWVDRHPTLVTVLWVLVALGVLGGLATGLLQLVRLL